MGGGCSKCRTPVITMPGKCLRCQRCYCEMCLDDGERDMARFVWCQLALLFDIEPFLPTEMWDRIHSELLFQEMKTVILWWRPLRLDSCWFCTKDVRLQAFFHLSNESSSDDDNTEDSSTSTSTSTTSTPIGQ